MSTPFSRLAVTTFAALLALSIAGCGRRGDPEPPTLTKPAETSPRPIGIPIAPTAAKTEKPKVENKPFLLDFLL